MLRLLRLLHSRELSSAECNEFESELKSLVGYIGLLSDKHCKKKWSEEYVCEKIFSTKELFTLSDYDAFCRVNLKIGYLKFRELASEISERSAAAFEDALRVLGEYEKVLYDFVFDLKWVVEHLERKSNPDYKFFEGGKSHRAQTFHLYKFSKALAYIGVQNSGVMQSYHKEAMTASAFVLRQSLELKFERAIGVDIRDVNGGRPKLKHGFHYSFILNRADLFEIPSASLKNIKKVYDWCSDVVHKGHQPLVWQMPYAYDVCSGLYGWGEDGKGGASIYGAMRVLNMDVMQNEFAAHFSKSYDHGVWCFGFHTPEAVSYCPSKESD